MFDVIGGNGYVKNHTLYLQDWGYNNGGVSIVNDSINIHTLLQCNNSSIFKYMDGYVDNEDISNRYVSMNGHTVYQQNSLNY